MLRASVQSAGITMNLEAIGDPAQLTGRDDADALLRFATAVVTHSGDLDDARTHLASVLGAEAVPGASGAAGNFEMMNRILDATGVPVPRSMGAIAPMIGLKDLAL